MHTRVKLVQSGGELEVNLKPTWPNSMGAGDSPEGSVSMLQRICRRDPMGKKGLHTPVSIKASVTSSVGKQEAGWLDGGLGSAVNLWVVGGGEVVALKELFGFECRKFGAAVAGELNGHPFLRRRVTSR